MQPLAPRIPPGLWPPGAGPAPVWPAWPFELAAWALVILGLPLLIYALRWDRGRRRQRCDRCWYDLAGLALPATAHDPPATCPECGRVIRTARQTMRRRRRPLLALAGLVCLTLASIVQHAPSYPQWGWRGLVPSGLLIVQAYLLPPRHDDPLSAELLERVLSGRGMWRWQQRWGARVIGPMLVDYRDRWPEGQPIDLALPAQITLRDESLRRFPLGEAEPPSLSSFMGIPQGAGTDELAPLPPGWHDVPIWITLRDGRQVPGVLPLLVRGPLEAHLRPHAHDPTVVRDVLRPRLMDLGDAGMVIDVQSGSWASMRARAFPRDLAIEMHLLEDGQPVARARWRLPRQTGGSWALPATQVRLEGEAAALQRARAAIMGPERERARWSLRFRGDPSLALSDPSAVGYWSGELVMPLDDLLRPPP